MNNHDRTAQGQRYHEQVERYIEWATDEAGPWCTDDWFDHVSDHLRAWAAGNSADDMPGIPAEQHKASAEQWAELRARVEALEEAENDRRFKACMAAIDAATPEQIRAAAGLPEHSSLVKPSDIFPTEYADSDGDGIRILMEPADETGQVCWVVRNSRHVNPCHEFPTPEAAYAAHKAASVTQSVAPASSLVERVAAAPDARAAIREVAAAARIKDHRHWDPSGVAQLVTWEGVAQWLEQEVDR